MSPLLQLAVANGLSGFSRLNDVIELDGIFLPKSIRVLISFASKLVRRLFPRLSSRLFTASGFVNTPADTALSCKASRILRWLSWRSGLERLRPYVGATSPRARASAKA